MLALVDLLISLTSYYLEAYPYLPHVDPMYDSMMPGLQPSYWFPEVHRAHA